MLWVHSSHLRTYMVMESGRVDTVQDNWYKQRKKVGATQESWTGFTVFSNKIVDIEAYLVGKARGQGEVFEHEIRPQDWPGWRESDAQEWNKVASTPAIRVLSVEESRQVRQRLTETNQLNRILPARMVRRWKPAEQPGEPDVRKSRWCIRGDKDPDLLDLERYAPTLNTTSFGVLLQIAASMRYAASVGDLKNAFCQSMPLLRAGGKLYAAQPKSGIDGRYQLVEGTFYWGEKASLPVGRV